MNHHIAQHKIAAAVGGTVGHRGAVDLERTFGQQGSQPGRRQVLEHSAQVLGAGVFPLPFSGLFKQVVQSGADRLGGVRR